MYNKDSTSIKYLFSQKEKRNETMGVAGNKCGSRMDFVFNNASIGSCVCAYGSDTTVKGKQ